LAISHQKKFPSNYDKRACERLGTRRISNISDEELIGEIYRRECLKFEEEESEEESDEDYLPHSDDEHLHCSEISAGE
jgi:hypothetical protein